MKLAQCIVRRQKNANQKRNDCQNISRLFKLLESMLSVCKPGWGMMIFFYCHWVAESEEDVYRQLDAFELVGKVVNSLISEMYQFVTAYRASDEIMRHYPEVGDKWC